MGEYVIGDIFDIGGRVKNIDPTLSLSFDRKRYQIKRNNTHIMYINHDELDSRVLTKLMKNDLTRRRMEDITLELERSEDEFERRKTKEMQNRIDDITLDNYDRMVGISHHSCGMWGDK